MPKMRPLPTPDQPLRNGVGAELTYRGVPDGPGSEVVLLPRFRTKVQAQIRAWATGYGDPDYEGCTADLMLRINNEVVKTDHDEKFTFYNLEVVKNETIPAKTETKISINFDNRLATEAGDPAHGLLVRLIVID